MSRLFKCTTKVLCNYPPRLRLILTAINLFKNVSSLPINLKLRTHPKGTPLLTCKIRLHLSSNLHKERREDECPESTKVGVKDPKYHGNHSGVYKYLPEHKASVTAFVITLTGYECLEVKHRKPSLNL